VVERVVTRDGLEGQEGQEGLGFDAHKA
jgi:hypothetical protein